MINDKFTQAIAKALNGESFGTPAYLTVGTSTLTLTPSLTSITGELTPRIATTSSRTDSQVTWTAVRSGTAVQQTATGDTLQVVAWLTAAASGDVHEAVSLPSLLQTTNFDIEDDLIITIQRQ